jgi:acyl dehydratase
MVRVQRGPTSWRTVTQEDIDVFARLTGDHHWIQVDVERAKRESPFGRTVAHGNLTLCMIDGLREQVATRDARRSGS